jgi:hypothetical protein
MSSSFAIFLVLGATVQQNIFAPPLQFSHCCCLLRIFVVPPNTHFELIKIQNRHQCTNENQRQKMYRKPHSSKQTSTCRRGVGRTACMAVAHQSTASQSAWELGRGRRGPRGVLGATESGEANLVVGGQPEVERGGAAGEEDAQQDHADRVTQVQRD